jgi:hypothetical protein
MNIQKYDHVRLRKLIDSRYTVDNILHVYRLLSGKENLDKRLYLKTLVWASMEATNGIAHTWTPPKLFFSKFNKDKLEKYFQEKRPTWYGFEIDKIFGNLL